MNKMLFEKPLVKPERKELVKVLLWGRSQFKHTEDDWTEPELSLVRQQLGEPWKTLSLHDLKNWLIRVRKDKLAPRKTPAMDLRKRLGKLARDFKRARERRGFDGHSKQYDALMASVEWINTATNHRRKCDFRCQLCGRALKLQIHHTPLGYSYLGEERDVHLLALCEQCHLIADLLRHVHGDIFRLASEHASKKIRRPELLELFGVAKE